MENLTPIIFILVALLLSFLNKKKPTQGTPQGNPNPNQNPAPKPVDLETVFEEFFGKKEEQPQYEDEEYLPDDLEAEPLTTGGRGSFEPKGESQGYEFGTYENTENFGESVFQDHVNKTGVAPDYKFGGESFGFSTEQKLQEQSQYKDAGDNYEQIGLSTLPENFDDFSPRDAVIYSEIINRKY